MEHSEAVVLILIVKLHSVLQNLAFPSIFQLILLLLLTDTYIVEIPNILLNVVKQLPKLLNNILNCIYHC